MSGPSDPLVTVAIPTRNRSHFLRQCLTSVVEQSMTEIEIWISDNASTDETADVVASFDDPRIHYAPLEENIGLYGNLSRGLHLGRAPYLMLIPDDAMMHVHNVGRKVAMMKENADVDVVHSAARVDFMGPDGRITETTANFGLSETVALERGAHVVQRLLTEPYRISFMTSLIRRSLVSCDGFDEIDGPPADIGLALRVASRARVIAYIPEPLVVSRAHPDDASVKLRVRKPSEDGGSDSVVYQRLEANDATRIGPDRRQGGRGSSLRHGTQDGEEAAHRYAFNCVALDYKAKKRFLKEHAGKDPEVRRLRRTVRQMHSRSLLYHLRTAGGIDRSRRATWTLLREAYRAEPRLFPPLGAARFLAGGWLGRRGRDVVRLRWTSTSTHQGGA